MHRLTLLTSNIECNESHYPYKYIFILFKSNPNIILYYFIFSWLNKSIWINISPLQASRIYLDIRSGFLSLSNIFGSSFNYLYLPNIFGYSFEFFFIDEYVRIFVHSFWTCQMYSDIHSGFSRSANIFGYSFEQKISIRYSLKSVY